MKTLVTGAAGFIGFHLSRRLIDAGHEVVGLDNLNDYYDVNLKKARLKILEQNSLFKHVNINLEDAEPMAELFKAEQFTHVVNLAAQGGRSLLHREPQVLHRLQRGRFSQCARRLPP